MMALLLDLACLSYRGLRRRPVMPACLLLVVILSSTGGTILMDGIQTASGLNAPASRAPECAGLLRLGRAWPGMEQLEMVSTGRLSALIEMLRYLGCAVSPVFIYGEDEEKHIQLGTSDLYVRSGLMGVGSDYREIAGPALQVVDGRFFDKGEMDSAIRVAVVGASLAALMQELHDSALSQQVSVEGVSYEVVGVVAEGPGYRSRYGDMSVAERIVFPYTTLADHAAASSGHRLDLRAVAYRHPGSITGEFVDRVINDWLRRNDLLEGRFVSHVRSLALTGTEEAAGVRGPAMPVAVYAWIALFTVVPAAVLGYLRMAERADELELVRIAGASPLHLSVQIGLESLSLAVVCSGAGALISALFVRPVLESLAGLNSAPEGSLRMWLLIMICACISSTAGSMRFVASRRGL